MGFVLLILGIGMIAGAREFDAALVLDIGPDFFPTIIGSLIAALSVILIISSAVKLKKSRAASTAKTDKPEKFVLSADAKRVLAAVVLLAGYVFLMPGLGFIISSAIYLMANMCLLAEKMTRRKIVLYAAISIVTAASVNVIFVRVFWLMLPRGILSF
ncbi:MAG: tripartite tricarboxylate transporter TctB family protein [Treponema sp.]|nr:tripartite tricarboxylate transporter TctB family protein [Treponema sp.]